MASPVSASHAVQSSPCTASSWRQRYKVRHARLLAGENGRKFAMHVKNVPNWAILGEQGEFCTAYAVRRSVLGEFCTGSGAVRLVQGESCTGSGPARFLVGECCVASAPSESPVAGLPLPTGTAAWPSSHSGAAPRSPARLGCLSVISHVIPLWLIQTLNLHRWNCNVFGVSRKMTAINYVRDLAGCGVAATSGPRSQARCFSQHPSRRRRWGFCTT